MFQANEKFGDRLSIGHRRFYYLTESDEAIASGDFLTANEYIDSFLATINEPKIEKEITEEFDKIEEEWYEQKQSLKQQKMNLSALEQYDLQQTEILLDAEKIKHRRVACWRIALKNGLFRE